MSKTPKKREPTKPGNPRKRRKAAAGRGAAEPETPAEAGGALVPSEPREVSAERKLVRQKLAELKAKRPELPDSPFRHIQNDKKRRYLERYSQHGNRSRACREAQIDQSTPYTAQWKEDPEFQEAAALAHEMAIDAMEDEVVRRGVEGVEEPVGWYQGVAGGTIRRYSDNLLMFRLKAEREKFRDRVDVRQSTLNLDLSRLPDPVLARLAAGENPAAVLAEWADDVKKEGRDPAEILVPDPETSE